MPRKWLRDSGFTLVELLAVMAILTILIAAAVPALQGDDSAKLRASVRRAGGLFDQARTLARTRSEPVRVIVLEDPSDDVRHRRTMAIAIGNGEAWEITSGSETFAEGVLFDVTQPGVPSETMAVPTKQGGSKTWRYYHIASNGTFSGSNPNFVVGLGFNDGGTVRIPNENRVDGFRVTAAARPFYFRTPDEIGKNLPES